MSLGIIAGEGDLPKLIIKECVKQKHEFSLILVAGHANLKDYEIYNPNVIEIGQVSAALKVFKDNNVDEIVFAGGVDKPSFSDLKVDKKGAKLLAKIVMNKVLGDDNVLTTVTNFFKKEGFKIIGANEIVADIIVDKGVLTEAQPGKEDLDNIALGKNALSIMSDFDIGQSIAVQQKQIIAVEAIEGTDEMIKRCESLKFSIDEKPVLIKIKKQNQNTKVDLPVVGIKTIENLSKSGFSGIAIKSGTTMLIQKEKVIALANKAGLFIVAI